jgi:hypothetical protein
MRVSFIPHNHVNALSVAKKFNHGSSRQKICCCCKIKYQCPECGKIHVDFIRCGELNRRKIPEIIELVENNDKLSKFFNFCDSSCFQSFQGSLPYMRKLRRESNLRYRESHPDEAKAQFSLCRKKQAEWAKENPDKVRENALAGCKKC